MMRPIIIKAQKVACWVRAHQAAKWRVWRLYVAQGGIAHTKRQYTLWRRILGAVLGQRQNSASI